MTNTTENPEVEETEVAPEETPTVPMGEITETDISAFDKFLGKETAVVKDFDPAKKIEAPAPVEEEKEVTPEIVTSVVPKPDSRDARMKDFSDVERGLLKKMPNDAFELVMTKLEKAREVETKKVELEKQIAQREGSATKLPEYWADHEESYTLSPTYKELTSLKSVGNAIVNHWRDQFAAIEAGENWRGIEYKDGKYFISSVEMEPSAKAKADVMTRMNAASHEAAQIDRELQQFIQGHKAEYSKTVDYVKEREAAIFSRYADEKAPQYEYVKTVLDSIPASLRRSPLAIITAKSIALNVELTNALKSYQEKTEKATQVKAVVKAQGPIRSNESGAAGSVSDDNLWDKFNSMTRS